MIFKKLWREIASLKSDIRELRIDVDCLTNNHEWVVVYGMSIRCKHCGEIPKSKGSATVTVNVPGGE